MQYTNLPTISNAGDIIYKIYLDTNFYANTVTLNNITLCNSDLDINGQRIKNIATPTADSDATTKLYVDNYRLPFYSVYNINITGITTGQYMNNMTELHKRDPYSEFSLDTKINTNDLVKIINNRGFDRYYNVYY